MIANKLTSATFCVTEKLKKKKIHLRILFLGKKLND